MSSWSRTEANSSGTPGLEPHGKDDVADENDEPSKSKLEDGVISAILSGDDGQAEIGEALPQGKTAQSDLVAVLSMGLHK